MSPNKLCLYAVISASIFGVACNPLGSMYLGTAIGHHYDTNINPKPKIAIDSITFYHPITNFYYYPFKSNHYFGSHGGDGSLGEFKRMDRAYSYNVDDKFSLKKIFFDRNVSDTLSTICLQALKCLSFNDGGAQVLNSPLIFDMPQLTDSMLSVTIRQVEKNSEYYKLPDSLVNYSQYDVIMKSVQTRYIGLISIIHVKSILKDAQNEDVADSHSIEIRMLIIDKFEKKIIACKSLTLDYGYWKATFTYLSAEQLKHSKAVKFYGIAFKELFKDCFRERKIEFKN